MRRRKLPITRRLIPFWLSLWLLASLGGPVAAWQHFDGTFCATCTSSPSVRVLDEDCALETQAKVAVGAPDDCRQCCESTPQNSPDKLISYPVQAAILPTFISFQAPYCRETRLQFAFRERQLDALPRPPPRGRAPPVGFRFPPFAH